MRESKCPGYRRLPRLSRHAMGRLSFLVRLKQTMWRLWRHLTGDSPYYHRFRFVADLSSANQVKKREIAFVAESSRLKWLVLLCPCGCGDRISANLMKTHGPFWAVKFENDGSVYVRPSFWVTEDRCGSHFILRKGQVQWCERLSSSD